MGVTDCFLFSLGMWLFITTKRKALFEKGCRQKDKRGKQKSADEETTLFRFSLTNQRSAVY